MAIKEVLEVGVSDLGIWDTFVGQTRGNEGDIASHFSSVRFGYFLWSSDHKSWIGLGLIN